MTILGMMMCEQDIIMHHAPTRLMQCSPYAQRRLTHVGQQVDRAFEIQNDPLLELPVFFSLGLCEFKPWMLCDVLHDIQVDSIREVITIVIQC